jgi:hypothetical protein
MTWKCPRCGTENTPGERPCVGGCGYTRMAVRVVLTSEATGKKLRMHVSTPVGQSLLRTIADGEAAYASEPQFEIVKDEERGAWLIRHSVAARNPTYFNGLKIGEDTPSLAEGARITIGQERTKLTVSLEDA